MKILYGFWLSFSLVVIGLVYANLIMVGGGSVLMTAFGVLILLTMTDKQQEKEDKKYV